MTTISSTTAAAVQVAPSRRTAIEPGNEATFSARGEKEVMVFRRGTQTAEQTAQVAKHRAVAAEMTAGFAKQVREAEKLRPEIREVYSPNIATMSLESARTAAGQATISSQANSTAASIYRQMQSLLGQDGNER